jgi:hypothetical protein
MEGILMPFPHPLTVEIPMRAFILTATLATAFTAAIAAAPSQSLAPTPNSLCPIQHSAVNAGCPMINSNGQDLRTCQPGAATSSETPSYARPNIRVQGRNK